jgi:electron transport complex protein RnfB
MYDFLMELLVPVLTVGIMGVFFGTLLTVFSKILAVRKDARIEKIEQALPGINCGACGFPGCSGYAEAIIKDDAEITLCAPGGPETQEMLAEITGKEVGYSEKRVAQVHCRGNQERAKKKFEYNGLRDCNAAFHLFGGDKVCEFGCLGLGSCMSVCPVNAIRRDSEDLIWVDKELCISCGKCMEVCPTGVMQWVPYSADYIVACNSKDKGGVTKKYCDVGCIGCKICSKKSPEGGFIIENFLARIDYEQEGSRQEAQSACPAKCIVPHASDLPSHLKVFAKQTEKTEAK